MVAAVPLAEGEAGDEHPVEEALEPRRHRPPPVRVDQHQVVGPGDQAARPLEVGLERLRGGRAFDDVRVEGEVAEAQRRDRAARRARALREGAGERAAEALVARVAQDDQDAHAATLTPRPGGAGRTDGSYLVRSNWTG